MRGFAAASAVAGAGSASPVQVVARARDGADAHAAAERVRAALAADPGIADVAAPRPSRDGGAVLLVAQTRADPESAAAKATVERLRDPLRAAAGRGVQVDVGGVTASQLDLDDLVSGGMWKILLFLLGLSYLVLLVLLRSVVLPAKAVLMNLLSVGASFGVLTLAFDEVDTLTPPLVLAVVFGLSMDYEVFLLTRIRERYHATGDTRLAVAQGLAASARTITSAALIMVAVFAVFVAHRRAVDPADRSRHGRRDRARRDARAAGPRPGHDGAAGGVELVPPAPARTRAPGGGLRGGAAAQHRLTATNT